MNLDRIIIAAVERINMDVIAIKCESRVSIPFVVGVLLVCFFNNLPEFL